ncbi:hypothetical protein BST61_g4328 [Cercospora zeina]
MPNGVRAPSAAIARHPTIRYQPTTTRFRYGAPSRGRARNSSATAPPIPFTPRPTAGSSTKQRERFTARPVQAEAQHELCTAICPSLFPSSRPSAPSLVGIHPRRDPIAVTPISYHCLLAEWPAGSGNWPSTVDIVTAVSLFGVLSGADADLRAARLSLMTITPHCPCYRNWQRRFHSPTVVNSHGSGAQH